MTSPRVSVLMPVFNAAAYLAAAIDSVLAQTLSDLELLVVDDGSNDDSVAIARSFGDPRVRLVDQPGHRGIGAALNRGLDLARGAFVARMDADDVSLPARLARQVEFLEAHPRIGICGTWARTIGLPPPGQGLDHIRHPTDPDDVAATLFFEPPFVHPTVMLRTVLVRTHGLRYDPGFDLVEDFELWTRAATVTGLANLPEVLVEHRRHPGQTSVARAARQRDLHRRVQVRQLRRLEPEADEAAVAFHHRWLGTPPAFLAPELVASQRWARRLVTANSTRSAFPPRPFRRLVARAQRRHWHRALTTARPGLLGAALRTPPLAGPLTVEALRLLAASALRRARTAVRSSRGDPP